MAQASHAAMHPDLLQALAEAATSKDRVEGFTHGYYRYPARFSPQFAHAAISLFSKPGQLVLDPYMGGGTTVVEALALGRPVVGNDLNSLAVFIAKVKTTLLTDAELGAIADWAAACVPQLSYRAPLRDVEQYYNESKMRNMTHVRARFIKKIVAATMASMSALSTDASRDLARCAVLRVSQLALDGRRKHMTLTEFRGILAAVTKEMLVGMRELRDACPGGQPSTVHLSNCDAEDIAGVRFFGSSSALASLVVTSPPYPGVHVLYHRWQVDGRRETAAPYWIAACNDGQGASFYNFGDRREPGLERYFVSSLRTLQAIRRVMADGALMVQIVAFSDPEEQMPRYLRNMAKAGFREVAANTSGPGTKASRIWRDVPNRKWHAVLNGMTHSSREVVLVHAAI